MLNVGQYYIEDIERLKNRWVVLIIEINPENVKYKVVKTIPDGFFPDNRVRNDVHGYIKRNYRTLTNNEKIELL